MRSVKTTGGLTRGRGMTETQRLVWVMSMPICADVNNAMQSLTGTNYSTSEQHNSTGGQHKDASKAMKERDYGDTLKILEYLSLRSPFSTNKSLRNIATGVVAEESVNCDKAKEVGEKIIQSMRGKKVDEFSFKKKNQALTLASRTAVPFSDGYVQIDPQLLFQRLSFLATSGRYEDPQALFKYEMSSYPSALFDSSLLPRQANKSVLADAIWAQTESKQTARPVGDLHYVVDGGALIHRVIWPHGVTYDAVCAMYVQYVQGRYGNATIVFDGYQGPSTKGCTHQRRAPTSAPPVAFDSGMLISLKKKDFLSNQENKQRFINLLAEKLRIAGCTVFQAPGDADLLIVQTAVQVARTHTTVLVGDDTDLLVLLIYHGQMDASDLFFIPEPKQRSKNRRVWNIKKTKSALGLGVCTHILFGHALLGSDTTSRIHGLGKPVALRKLKTDEHFRNQASVFDKTAATTDEVMAAGERALVSMYNGKATESLDSLRYSRYCLKVATGNTCVQPESLPPTSAAARFHSLRVYHQVQQWKGTDLPPQEWGWEMKGGNLSPTRTNLPAAHASLLEIIRCNCKTDCSTQRCSCRKNGLDCSAACGACKGVSCVNSPQPELTDSEVDGNRV